jgi:NitT/TauT family transport system permease protein
MGRVTELDVTALPPGVTRIRPLPLVDDHVVIDDGALATDTRLGDDLAGLDALDTALPPQPSRLVRTWSAVWPLLAAVALFSAGWQIVVWTGWKPSFLLPGPRPVATQLWHDIGSRPLWDAVRTTLGRALKGYAFALVIGGAIGIAAVQSRILRAAVSSLLTGLQTMPSIAWFPAVIALFRLTETAMFAVVVLGAAPSIASGVITGIDHVPPTLKRAGRVLGARGLRSYRHVVLPAALPGFVNGLKQGWAFAWRSLMAAELIAQIPGVRSLGFRLDVARTNSDYTGLYATMVVILAIGIAVDLLVFARLEGFVRRRWGLAEHSA